MSHIIPKPTYDAVARHHLESKVAARFLTQAERRQRILAAMEFRGIPSVNQLAVQMGLPQPNIVRMMGSPRPSLLAMQRFAVALDVSMAYLTEKKVEK